MNIFMPETSVTRSVAVLDDKRLIKQILECYQIIKINDRVLAGEEKVGYRNHPVVKFYRDKRDFLIYYGICACGEYYWRFCKEHKYDEFFNEEFVKLNKYDIKYNILYCEKRETGLYEETVEYEYNDSSQDTLIDNVHLKFRQKLINKWKTDKCPPKWTNEERPGWYNNKEI